VGAGGDDILYGKDGHDTMHGGDGNDWAGYAGSDAAVQVNLRGSAF